MKIEIGKGGGAVAKLKQGEIKKITQTTEDDAEKDFKGSGIEGTKDKKQQKRKKKQTPSRS